MGRGIAGAAGGGGAIAACALILAACTPATAPAGKILSLNPCTDALLAELADPGQIAALSAYSSTPGQGSMDVKLARRFPASHGTMEEVLALRPALVLTGNMTAPATRAAFARIGIPLVELPIARSVVESESQIRRVARATGHVRRGEALVARIEAALRAAAPPSGSPVIPALVWQAGGMVPGRETLITELLARTGFTSFSAARGLHQASLLPLEAVLADPPRALLAAGDPSAQSDRLLAHPAFARLPATRRFAFDPALEYCGGPTILRAVARLAQVRQAMSATKPSPLSFARLRLRGGVTPTPNQ